MTRADREHEGTLEVPDATMPLIGFREWALRGLEEERPALHSLFHPTPWPEDAAMAAVCLRPTAWPFRPRFTIRHGRTPDERCECGIYAYLSPDFSPFKGARGPVVRGVVLGWGRYVLGSSGWRSEFARTAALVDGTPEHEEVVEEIAGRHHVPLISDLRDVALGVVPYAA